MCSVELMCINETTLSAAETACTVTISPLNLQLWHEHFCHHNSANIQKVISNGLTIGITLSSSVKCNPIGEPCLTGKMHSSLFPSTRHHALAFLDLIHTDLCSPLLVSTSKEYQYWCVFTNDHTHTTKL